MSKRQRPDLDVELIVKELGKYTEGVTKEIKKAARKLSKEAKQVLKETSPRSDIDHEHYADSWTTKINETDKEISVIIHNKKKPGLTHLLEFGHTAVNGTRVDGITHIAPVQEKINKDFAKECERIIGN